MMSFLLLLLEWRDFTKEQIMYIQSTFISAIGAFHTLVPCSWDCRPIRLKRPRKMLIKAEIYVLNILKSGKKGFILDV